jgi:hypothetical protein
MAVVNLYLIGRDKGGLTVYDAHMRIVIQIDIVSLTKEGNELILFRQ